MTIVVGGYIIGLPFGGMTWHHLNYLLGLHALGHEVWFLEDSGEFSMPYNPVTWETGPDSTYGRQYLERTFTSHGLPDRYCYYSQFEDRHYGLTRDQLHALLERADLLLCVSGVTPLRHDRPRPRRTCVIDTDPVFTQLRMQYDGDFLAYYRAFDRCATFGTLIGTPLSPLPTHGIDWVPTRQPIHLPAWPMTPIDPRAPFSTIGRWEHDAGRHVEFNGQRYLSSKGVEWEKLIDLPRRVPADYCLAMGGIDGSSRERFESAGWRFVDAGQATISTQAYEAFLRGSLGELTVAKQIYAGLPSGWFSDRSACYLASGRPVITQSSGFERWLPTGEGLFSFNSLDEAEHAVQQVLADPVRHALAARRIAETEFDATTVLTQLLDDVL